jgi:hypothetical protein
MRPSYGILSVLLAVLMVSAVMPASAHINLLQNPGFETGSAAPWIFDGQGVQGVDWFGAVVSNHPPHAGTYYAYISVELTDAWVRQDVSPRCAQYLELWYWGSYAEAGGVLWVEIYYSDGTHTAKDLAPAEGWSFVHIDLNTAKLVKAVEGGIGAYAGDINLDDFDLEACAAPVGGVLTPANTFAIVAPWLAVIGVVGCIGAVVVVVVKKRRA